MKLNTMTDIRLLHDLKKLVRQEREILSQVLWHLKEVDQRKLYSKEGSGSLFDYCVKVLKYSEGQASRRVTACRLLRELPEISLKIEDGSLNLTQLNQVKHFFNEENIVDKAFKHEILKKIEGHTTRESEQILWSLKSEDSPKKVTVVLKEESLQKLQKLQALKAHLCPDMDALIDKIYLELDILWNPELQKPRMTARVSKGLTRYVSLSDKTFLWKRDKGRCQNCGSNYALQIDHVKPFAIGGKTIPDNLRLLCRNCNQRKGIEVFGRKQRLH